MDRIESLLEHCFQGLTYEYFQYFPARNAQFLLNASLDGWDDRVGKLTAWCVEDDVLHVVPNTGDLMPKTNYSDF
tara:strand:- start:383 stop:607 length:225 start_codon:yes stop_codon:yes gene_type:complete